MHQAVSFFYKRVPEEPITPPHTHTQMQSTYTDSNLIKINGKIRVNSSVETWLFTSPYDHPK